MILETLGKVLDAEACADTDGYIGYCVDMARATGYAASGRQIWIVLSVNVAADYTTGDETYEFQLRTGTGTDGTDINAGAMVILSTSALNGDDARLDAAGDFILRCSVPYETDSQQYWQWYYAQTGTTNTITVDGSFSPSPPRSNYNIQVASSNVTVPT
jgi:hypothetical protein